MRRVILLLLAFLAVSLIILLLLPSPISPVAWTPPQAPPLSGNYQQNNALAKVHILFEGQCQECEDVAIDASGNIYGGQINGEVVQFSANGRKVVAKTGGRPLGMHFDQQQNLIVADAKKGVLSINVDTGKMTTLVDGYEGEKMLLVDDLEIAKDGTIYFSDASTKFNVDDSFMDILEGGSNGRLFAYYPNTRQTKLLLDDLYFANGVAVAHDQSYVLVCETSRYRISRYWLTGPKKGQSEVFLENLPGFPDGISQGMDGLFWVALASPRKASLDKLSSLPFIKNIIAKLPTFLQPAPTHYSFVLGVDGNGAIQYNLQDPKGTFSVITSVQQFGNDIYLGSLYENGVGRYSMSQVIGE